MFVLYLIVFLFPAVVATYISEKIGNTPIAQGKRVYIFCSYASLILWLNVLIQFYRGWNEFAFERLSVQFLLKYIPTSFFLAILLPYTIKFLDRIVGKYITGKYKRKY